MSPEHHPLDGCLGGRRGFWKKNKHSQAEGSGRQMLAGDRGRPEQAAGCSPLNRVPHGTGPGRARALPAGSGPEPGQRKCPRQDATSLGSLLPADPTAARPPPSGPPVHASTLPLRRTSLSAWLPSDSAFTHSFIQAAFRELQDVTGPAHGQGQMPLAWQHCHSPSFKDAPPSTTMSLCSC